MSYIENRSVKAAASKGTTCSPGPVNPSVSSHTRTTVASPRYVVEDLSDFAVVGDKAVIADDVFFNAVIRVSRTAILPVVNNASCVQSLNDARLTSSR